LKYARIATVVAVACSALVSQSVGPDVIVGDLYDSLSHGSDGTNYAYSIGTISCNVGTVPLNWVSSTNQHPVIGCGMYRLKDGKFEQIGLSWLKHGFTALTQNLCATCINPGTGSLLGVNCSDPYSASLNGSASNLGPRFQVNPFTGFFSYPYAFGPSGNTTTRGRIQVAPADNDPVANAGALYFVEGQYVTPDDSANGNQFNNTSWRPITITNNATRSISLAGSTIRKEPAVFAWRAADPTVSISALDVPGEGRFYVGYKATSLGGGQWSHEYAVQNVNSDRAGGGFSVALPSGVTASNLGFHDVHYHSGEVQLGTDWTSNTTPGLSAAWTVVAGPTTDSTNALRWGTLYNFRFEANAAWLPDVTIGLYKAGTPGSISATLCKVAGLSKAPIAGGFSSATVAYDFVDATAGTAGPAGDDVGTTVTLPFPFTLFGTTATQLVLSTNGYVAMPGEPGDVYTNVQIPGSGAPNGFMAPYWDDLEIGNVGASGASTGWCRYLTVGTAPNRRFVVHWNDAQRFNSNVNFSFQCILDETTNDITFTQISTGTGTTGGSATRGVEDPTGTTGIQLSYNTSGSAVAGTSVRVSQAPVVYGDTALLTMSGDGSFANPFKWNVVSDPNAPLTLFVDVAPGPVYIAPLQVYAGLGMTPGLLAIVDATGYFGPANPTAFTGPCNEWSMSLPVSVDPVPPTLVDVWFQALVYSSQAPNGLVHFSTVATY
jgi:hypothetical protein